MEKSKEEVGLTDKQDCFWGGILLIVMTLGILLFYYTPSDKEDIKAVYSACNAKINFFGQELNVGSFGQKLLNKEDVCRSAYYQTLVLTYGWLGYVFGGILLVYSFFVKEKS